LTISHLTQPEHMSSTPAPRSRFVPARLADWLVEQHRHKHSFDVPPAALQIDTLKQATQVQQSLVRMKSRDCGPTAGWKIALATPVMQQMVGLNAPIAGRLHHQQVVSSPASTRLADYGRLLIEFEIAVELGRDLPKGDTPHTPESVVSAVKAIGPAMEIADDRAADYSQLARLGLYLVADNAWNEGAVLGRFDRQWKKRGVSPKAISGDDGLGSLRGEAFINGVSVGGGHGRDLMGHPLKALAWLANEANARGEQLSANDVCILGSLVSSKFPKQGDELRFELEGFEPIRLSIQ
jgi:2-keto-4-pentenoate hydratase